MRKNLFIIIAGIMVFCVFGFDLLPNVYLDTGFKIAIYLLACILVFIDMKLKNRKLEKEEEKEQNRKKQQKNSKNNKKKQKKQLKKLRKQKLKTKIP